MYLNQVHIIIILIFSIKMVNLHSQQVNIYKGQVA